jgi:cytoskeletal protein CcmA (bactofilin family)
MQLLWALGLLSLTAFVFSVPLWPAFIELARRRTSTLPIDRLDDGSVRHAALQRDIKPQELVVGQGAHDLAYADDVLRIEPGSTFRWLDAPTISFSHAYEEASSHVLTAHNLPLQTKVSQEKFIRIEGYWETPPHTEIHGDYVVMQDITVAEGTVVLGSLKSYGDVRLCEGAIVHGSIFAQKSVQLMPGSKAFGVVSAAQQVYLHPGSTVGHVQQPSSVSAPHITAYVGAVVHGSVQASVQGLVQV